MPLFPLRDVLSAGALTVALLWPLYQGRDAEPPPAVEAQP